MRRSLSLTALLALFVAGSLLIAADEKKDTPKGTLPANWKKLGLSDAQVKQIYTIQADYKAKIEDLESQLKKLKDKQHDELIKVLTDEQKKHLRDLKDPIGSSSSADPKTSPSSSSK